MPGKHEKEMKKNTRTLDLETFDVFSLYFFSSSALLARRVIDGEAGSRDTVAVIILYLIDTGARP